MIKPIAVSAFGVLVAAAMAGAALAQVPPEIAAAPGESVVVTFHARRADL